MYGVGKVPIVVLILVEAFLVADAVGNAGVEPGCLDGRGFSLGLFVGVILFDLSVGPFSFLLVLQRASRLDPFVGRVLWSGFLGDSFAEEGEDRRCLLGHNWCGVLPVPRVVGAVVVGLKIVALCLSLSLSLSLYIYTHIYNIMHRCMYTYIYI